MSNTTLYAATIAAILVQTGTMIGVLLRRRGMQPVLVVNLAFAAAVLLFIAPTLPDEIAVLRTGASGDLLDYQGLIWGCAEAILVVASVLAFRGAWPAMVIAWIGFSAHLLSTLAALAFFLTFEFKCCGYL